MKIWVMLGDGFEEIEALTVVDVARRALIDTLMVSVSSELKVTSARGISVIADKLIEDIEVQDDDMMVIPGGLKGVQALEANERLRHILKQHRTHNGLSAAICAGPMIPGKQGLLDGLKASCYPGFEQYLEGAEVVNDDVVVDKNFVTARGAGVSLPFAFAIVALIKGNDEAEKIKKAMIFPCS